MAIYNFCNTHIRGSCSHPSHRNCRTDHGRISRNMKTPQEIGYLCSGNCNSLLALWIKGVDGEHRKSHMNKYIFYLVVGKLFFGLSLELANLFALSWKTHTEILGHLQRTPERWTRGERTTSTVAMVLLLPPLPFHTYLARWSDREGRSSCKKVRQKLHPYVPRLPL